MKVKYNEEEAKHIFFTSDTHFDHKNILRFCNRPWETVEEMNQGLIDNWNSVVGPDDIVFHLGDVSFGGNTNLTKYVSQLNGHIILVKGNHDKKLQESICNKLFEYSCQQLRLNIEGYTVVLNHYPFLCFPENIQLFGHIHSSPSSESDDVSKFLSHGDQHRQYDVGVDNNDYKPVSWQQIKSRYESTEINFRK